MEYFVLVLSTSKTQTFIEVFLTSLGYSSRQNLHTTKCELSSFVTVFSVFRFSCAFFGMNESLASADGQSIKLTEQATPAVHNEDDPGQNASQTM